MKKEIRDKWCDALRSGKFEQGQGCLRTRDDQYCCLGVLYTVTGAKWERGSYEDTLGVRNIHIYNQDDYRYSQFNNTDLGDDKKEFGISSDQEGELMDMNDNKENLYPFPVIADWIEQNIPIEN